ncbi:MAG: hypothetical protein JNL89_03565 [Rhodanobacteraceae bacterium]|nr:hypothetical protein [Rhodanobacteraceae bacterium]
MEPVISAWRRGAVEWLMAASCRKWTKHARIAQPAHPTESTTAGSAIPID